MSLRERLIGNRRGRMQTKEPVEEPVEEMRAGPVDDGSTFVRLTAENSWLKTVTRSMLKRALKGTDGKVIIAKESDHVLFSNGHFLAIVDGTFLEFLFGLPGASVGLDEHITPGDIGGVKEYFDKIDVGESFVWSADNHFIIKKGNPCPRNVLAEATDGEQVDLVLSVWGFAPGTGAGQSQYYTVWPFIHCIGPAMRKRDPHLVAITDPKKAMYVQQDLLRIFGDDYGQLKYTIKAEALKDMATTQIPLCVWSPDDKLIGLCSRFNSNLVEDRTFQWWQSHLR